MLPGSRSRESCFPCTCPGSRAARVEGGGLPALVRAQPTPRCRPRVRYRQNADTPGDGGVYGKEVGVRAVVDQNAVVLPQKPHRVRLRCPVSPHRREPDHLLVTQTLANPLAEASRRIGKEMGGHAIKARSLAAGPPGG